jgi:hypothetical protein
MQIYQQLNSEESFTTWAELMNMDVPDYEEFLRKYDSVVNPEFFGKRTNLWWNYNTIGVLLEEGLIDPYLVSRLLGPLVVMQWEKWRSIIEWIRENENIPENLAGFEHLANEMARIRRERDYPDTAYGKPYRERPELRT